MPTLDNNSNVITDFGRHFIIRCDKEMAMGVIARMVGVREVGRSNGDWIIYIDLRFSKWRMREKILRELREERTP